jgi:serine protease SohB
MFDALFQLGIFTAKSLIIVLVVLFLLAGILALLSRGKDKLKGKVTLKNLSQKFAESAEELSQEILPKKQFKQFLKERKKKLKEKQAAADKSPLPSIFLVDFQGDMKASAVAALREEITAILSIAKPIDEVVVRVESAGGMVHAYGLAAAQLQRIKQRKIPLTVCVDKIAASGGYMMASIADKILAAPFAIIGSIGVIVQIPNFHRLLKAKHIDFEQLTAGNFKRTLTLFGENTKEGREKLRQEIEEVHHLFKDLIKENRPQLNIEQVATGEHWLAKQAIEFKLVDDLKTSDDYLLEKSESANVFELSYFSRKTLVEKLTSSVNAFKKAFQPNQIY